MTVDPHLQRPRVGLFVTCLVDLVRPSVGFAAVRLLEAAGCEVIVPPEQTCCGQPAYNSGATPHAAALARQTISSFDGVDYVVAPSGSCAGMLRAHYPELLKDDRVWHGRAITFAERVHELMAFLVDVRGFGELPGLDPKLMSYLGIADSFAMGYDAARAAEAMLDIAPKVVLVGKGACGSLVALYAGLMEKRVSRVIGLEAIEHWSELFDDAVPSYTLQPRVMYGATIEHLRAMLARPIEWQARKSPAPDLRAMLAPR